MRQRWERDTEEASGQDERSHWIGGRPGAGCLPGEMSERHTLEGDHRAKLRGASIHRPHA